MKSRLLEMTMDEKNETGPAMEPKQARPHDELICELLDPSRPKTEREHAAVREIEALRVDVEAWKASHSMLTDTCHHFQARAERLAEALRASALAAQPAPSVPVGVDANELTGVRARLKSGDYDGADVMRAWLAIDKLLAQKPAADRDIEAEALQYVFGNIDRLGWAQIVDEQMTPPWPLPHHVEAMGMFKQPGGSDNDH